MPPWASALPSGSKLWLLNLGYLDGDAAQVLVGANIFPANLGPQEHERRNLIMISALIYHPDVGLILFDTGSCKDVIKNWPAEAVECTPRHWTEELHGLPEAIKATGAGTISDVKAVVLSHLHLDHAGGLEHFIDSDVEIWCHERELKNAFWAYSTKIDQGLYRPHYLLPDNFKWKTFSEPIFEIWQGITLHLVPGHTDGSIMMELELEKQGTVLLTGDLFHVKENYEDGRCQGVIMRDYNEWFRSRSLVQALVRKKRAKVLLGHEVSYFEKFAVSPKYTE